MSRASRRSHTDRPITHKLRLEAIHEGCALKKRGESIRAVVEF